MITYEHFRNCLSNSLVKAGLPPSQYKTHSFRIGAASTAPALDITNEDIQHMGRWKSLAFKRYVRMPTMYAPLLGYWSKVPITHVSKLNQSLPLVKRTYAHTLGH